MVRNVTQCLEILAVLYCLSCLFGRKWEFSKYSVILIIADLVLFTGINEYGFPMYLFSLSYVGLFLYGLAYYKKSIRITIVKCFFTVIVVSVLQLIFNLPVSYFFIMKYGNDQMGALLINAGCLIALIIVGNRLKLKEISDFFIKKNMLLIMISIFVMVCLGERIYQVKKNGGVATEDYVQIIFFVLLFFFTINEWQKSKLEIERKKTQLEMNKLYYGAYDDLLTLVRERQHDVMNHINAIYGMIYTIDNYDDLVKNQKEYCEYVVKNSKETKLLLSAGNPLIAGFIYRKVQEAEKHEIKVEYDLVLQESELRIPEYEIIEMVGILFDNAMEALANQNEVKKKILININNKGGSVNISVANSGYFYKNSEINQFFQQNFSSKGKGRGIGLTKLKKMVHDLSGEICVSNEKYDNENYLKFSIVIP